jgi:hypothetical protein
MKEGKAETPPAHPLKLDIEEKYDGQAGAARYASGLRCGSCFESTSLR